MPRLAAIQHSNQACKPHLRFKKNSPNTCPAVCKHPHRGVRSAPRESNNLILSSVTLLLHNILENFSLAVFPL